MPERVFEAAFAAACNANYVKVTRQKNRLRSFDDSFFEKKLRELGVPISPGTVVGTRALNINFVATRFDPRERDIAPVRRATHHRRRAPAVLEQELCRRPRGVLGPCSQTREKWSATTFL